jgi:3-oxoacyl-[acyl-carrier protein] reductase
MPSQAKVIVVTGATSGLGKSIVLEAANRNYRIALLARKQNKLNSLEKKIGSMGAEVFSFRTDVTNPTEIRKSFGSVIKKWKHIDILFNCAGVVTPVAPIVKCSNQALYNSLMTNVFGTYICTREAIRWMNKQSSGGTIINITSGAADHPYSGLSAYGSQKAAINTFTRAVAVEYQDSAIRIFALSPGPFQSKMQVKLRNTRSELFPAQQKFINLYEKGNLPHPDTIAPLLLDISETHWPTLSARIEDIRSKRFQDECKSHQIDIPESIIGREE